MGHKSVFCVNIVPFEVKVVVHNFFADDLKPSDIVQKVISDKNCKNTSH